MSVLGSTPLSSEQTEHHILSYAEPMHNDLAVYNELDVVFRFLHIPAESAEVTGFCLTYKDEEHARAVAREWDWYLTQSPHERLMEVAFTTVKEKMTLRMEISSSRGVSVTEVRGINPVHPQRISRSLRDVLYYLIVIGYETRGHEQVVTLSTPLIFKKDIHIDGKPFWGNNRVSIAWETLLSGKG